MTTFAAYIVTMSQHHNFCLQISDLEVT